jgi:GH24 family phage-related lysozyme (muramidase)
MQTAILSFAYQHGADFRKGGKRARLLWDQFAGQDWAGAIDSLTWWGSHDNGSAYARRRNGEIARIRRELPPPPPPTRRTPVKSATRR